MAPFYVVYSSDFTIVELELGAWAGSGVAWWIFWFHHSRIGTRRFHVFFRTYLSFWFHHSRIGTAEAKPQWLRKIIFWFHHSRIGTRTAAWKIQRYRPSGFTIVELELGNSQSRQHQLPHFWFHHSRIGTRLFTMDLIPLSNFWFHHSRIGTRSKIRKFGRIFIASDFTIVELERLNRPPSTSRLYLFWVHHSRIGTTSGFRTLPLLISP